MAPIDLPVLLTVRGTLVPPTLEAARVLHNETAGSAAGIAAARALGDLSHHVYAPGEPGSTTGARATELLFLDTWVDPAGIMQFFSNPHVQTQGAALFSAKDATVWMAARGSYGYSLPAPRGLATRYVGIIRGAVASPEAAIEAFRPSEERGIRDARRRGVISHQLYIKLAAPGDPSPLEVLGVDVWSDRAGMLEHYGDKNHNQTLAAAFIAEPAASVWEAAPGAWSEW